ncbi:TonB-dependent receptor [Chitinophaga lutea]|uniref:TonB-dependent receptor n=1 Tax=Chitinophaga lutea TaxID=2488634 RepID=A0A3N4PJU9_9BACT|nr:TonB-dependent receptor [Chitinophaga lutea]RPE08095.1 TonB-dependent receptor [Chitinophaga lutea]
MKKTLFLMMLVLVNASMALAQTRTVRGKIRDAQTGDGIPGVTVTIKGSSSGTLSGGDGTFKLDASPQDVLVFSSIGFVTQEQSAASTELDIRLVTSRRELSEIVVTGQGIGVEKRRLSTTVETISAKDIKAAPAGQLDQLLAGKLPGAQIRLNSGQPGTASLIRSRGIVSAYSSTTPVIYVDGVRVDNLNTAPALSLETGGAQSSAIADIPIENIERVEFIKGGAATTLYGSDAANGVLQIFTKKGSAMRPELDFEVKLGGTKGTEDYLHFKETADVLFRTGLYQNYRIGLSGGSDRVTYSFSGSFGQDDGFRPANQQKRYNFRSTVSAKVNKILTYTGSLGFSANQFFRDQNANSSYGVFGNLETGAYGELNKFNKTKLDSIKRAIIDPIMANVYQRETVHRFQTSQAFTAQILENLTAKASFGIDYRSSEQLGIFTNRYLIALGAVPPGTDNQGSIDVFNRNFLGLTGDFNIQHKGRANDFSFISTLGGQAFRNIDKQNALHGVNVVDGSRSVNNSGKTTAEDYELTVTNYGFYVAENIGFKDKLFLEMGLRMDANSAFGDNIGNQFYPKIGMSYDLAAENFIANSLPVVSQLRFRANYGKAGLFPPPFSHQRTITGRPFLAGAGFSLGQPGNTDLEPEKVATVEGGLDLGFLNNRFTLSATYYQAKTEGALFNAPYTPSAGLITQLRNIGAISNKGWEFASVLTVLDKKDFSLRLNASYNLLSESVVTSNGGTPQFSIGGFTFLGSFVDVNKPVGFLKGNRPTFDKDGKMTSSEANANLGSPIPKHSGSVGLSFTFKQRLTLYANGDYQSGAYGVNVDEVLRFFNGLSDDRIPEASRDESFFDLAGVWVEKTNYFKVRNISLNYQVPEKYVDRVFKGLEVGFMITNPINIYSSKFDPEVTGSGANIQNGLTVGGFGFGTESSPRQFIGTLRVKL